MQVVCTAVRANQLTSNLAEQILRVCEQLKHVGQHMDTHHANAMNNVFASMRQACCRDVDTLGMACRVKIMETIELRAMGWYCQPPYHPSPPQTGRKTSGANRFPGIRSSAPNMGNTVPMSAPPYNGMPMNGFYLVPANGFTPPGQWPPGGPPMFTPVSAAPWSAPSNWPRTPGSGHFKPTKKMSSQHISSTGKDEEILRVEMLIRNMDSGKIMGVRGRRVSAVEQMTNTIISFEQVPAGQPHRTLTINGGTKEEIDHARRLIAQTIERNASPIPEWMENAVDDTTNKVDDLNIDDVIAPKETPVMNVQKGQDSEKSVAYDGHPVSMMRSVYTRDYVLQCADSSSARVQPTTMCAPHEIVRTPPSISSD